MRLGKFVAFVGASAFLVAGCSAISSGDQPGSSGLSPAKFSTPLEGREALEGLNIFGLCTDPAALPLVEGGESVRCDVEKAEDNADRLGLTQRGVLLLVFRDGIPRLYCTYWRSMNLVGQVPLVTDERTFLVLGTMGEIGGSTLDFSSWPSELSPEDVRSALGGAVTSTKEFCE